MPKVRKNCKYSKNYNEESIQNAIIDIRNGMPKQLAAIKYGVPRSTIQFRLSENFKKVKHGPNSYLSKDEENLLVSWIEESHRKGFPQEQGGYTSLR